MAREFSRPQRVADFLRKELATLLQFEMRDPRLGMINLNDVEVSRDLAHAKVFVTFMNAETKEEAQEALEVLNHAAGFLRSRVSESARMRSVPRLHFYFDESVKRGRELSALIDQALAADDKLHKNDAE